MRKILFTFGVVLASVLALVLPARAQQINNGQMCIANSAGKDFCMNLVDGHELSGQGIQMWEAGHVENNWEQFKVGTVTDGNPGWPFTGNATVFNHLLRGEDVSILEYFPGRNPSGWCASQTTWDQNNNLGHVQLEGCLTNARFIYASNGQFMVPVWATSQSSELLSLGTLGLDNGQGVFSCQVCYGQWHWIGRA